MRVDDFKLMKGANSEEIPLRTSGIAMGIDRDYKFQNNLYSEGKGSQWWNKEDEKLMVWF